MQKPKQERQLDNHKEQLKVTKVELTSVNNELSKALKEKGSVLADISKLKDISIKISQENSEILNGCKQLQSELQHKEDTLSNKEQDIKKRELASIKYIEVEQKKLSDKETKHNTEVVKLKEKIDKEQKELDKLIEIRDKYLLMNENLDKDIKLLSKNKSNIESARDILIKDGDREMKKLDKEIKEKSSLLEKINKKVFKNQQLIEEPMKALELESKKLDRKKKNLDVMIMRFNKTFKKHYPTQELKL